MKKVILGLTLLSAFTAFAGEKEACRIDVFVKLKPAIMSSWVKAEYSDLNPVECLVKAFDLAEKNEKINIRLNDKDLSLSGKLKVRTANESNDERDACRIDVFVKLKPSILSTLVMAENSNLNAFDCLVKAYDLAEKNDKINIQINDKQLNIKGKLEIRK